ncbi:MAG: oligosaccharide flippase family protein [Bacteroidaceae bacterium]|jgi:O-antigen/teichoic acid export membrane protein|nr:oligosaccharide flippase family protein [Bacteroidaceae bacterium]
MDKLKNLHNPETSDTSYDHVLKYTGIFGGVQGLKMLVSVVRVKLTAYILGGWGMGLISAYNAVFEFLSKASNMGIPLNATRQTSELFEHGTEEQIAHKVMVIRTWVLWSAILSVLICLFFSPIISYFFFDHDWHRWPAVMLTSLVAVSNIIAEGECAILKGLRQVRKVAFIETILALGTLLCTIPMYYMLGIRGVIIGLIACGFLSAIVHFFFTLRMVSYRVKPLSYRTFLEGLPLIKVGIPYVLAGVANSCLQMVIPAIILASHTMKELGYYNAGWALMFGYAGLVFLALESDFFPRLSSVSTDKQKMNECINQQIDVCTLLITPLLILLVVFMPFVLQLLYETEFLVVEGMATIAVFYTFLRCLALPMGYSVLAKGHSIAFLVLEVCYDVFFGLLIWWCYNSWGLVGAGIAMSVGALYDVIVYFLYCHFRYGFVFRRGTLLFCIGQFICLLVAVEYCYLVSPSTQEKYTAGAVVFVMSLALSVYQLLHRSDCAKCILRRLKR